MSSLVAELDYFGSGTSTYGSGGGFWKISCIIPEAYTVYAKCQYNRSSSMVFIKKYLVFPPLFFILCETAIFENF